jgi:hypothetical protein
MAGRHGTDGWASVHDVREHARRCALAGKPIFVNPYVGNDAEEWFAAYRDVPESERGSQAHLAQPIKPLLGSSRGRGAARQWKSALQGSASNARGTLTAKQIATRIAYHERVLLESICVERRVRAERALAKLRAAVPCDQHVPTPRPWTEGAGL